MNKPQRWYDLIDRLKHVKQFDPLEKSGSNRVKGIRTELQPHQMEAMNKAMKSDTGVILAHTVGAGKTLTSIAIANALGKPVDAIVPASLIKNYEQEIKKHTTNESVPINLYSLQDLAMNPDKFRRTLEEQGVKSDDDMKERTLIVDEAHRLRNHKSKSYQLIQGLPYGKKILLTGTPIYNSPADLTNLLELLNKNDDVHQHLNPGRIHTEFYDYENKIKNLVDKKFKGHWRGYTNTEIKDIWSQVKGEKDSVHVSDLVDEAMTRLNKYKDSLSKEELASIKKNNGDNSKMVKDIAKIIARKKFEEKLQDKYGHAREFHSGIIEDLSKKYVHYYDLTSDKTKSDYVAKKNFVLDRVPMLPDQRKAYMTYFKQLPTVLQQKIVGNKLENLPPSAFQNPFFVYTREIANNYNGASPKIDKMVNDIKDSPGKVLSYSNFLEHGVRPLAQKLDKEGIPYGVFTGELSKKEKDKLIDDYNNDRIKTLIVSSAGGEGLNLKNTRMVQIMEPHWNEEKINQVIGRAVRMHSHDDLDPEDRNVTIKNYVSVFPDTKLNTTDAYMKNLSEWKQNISAPVKNIMTEFGTKAASMGNMRYGTYRSFVQGIIRSRSAK